MAARSQQSEDLAFLSISLFLSNGLDDRWVSVNLGRQAARVLKEVETEIEELDFSGVEAGGRWIKQPKSPFHRATCGSMK